MTVNSTKKSIDKPVCDKHTDCFANHGGRCECLIDNDAVNAVGMLSPH